MVSYIFLTGLVCSMRVLHFLVMQATTILLIAFDKAFIMTIHLTQIPKTRFLTWSIFRILQSTLFNNAVIFE